jgi:hypothetical protein
MADLLKLEKDVPAVIALAYEQGKIVESTIPGAQNQVMFSLVDGRRTFLPLTAADSIRAAGVEARVPFEITKLGPTKFRVRNIGVSRDYTPELEQSIATANRERAAGVVPTPATFRGTATTASNLQHSNGSAAPPLPAWDDARWNDLQQSEPAPAPRPMTAKLCATMCVLIDAMAESKAYAQRRGIDLTNEDLRCLVTTSFIADSKGGR